jgi:hypothetical protein
MIIHDTLFPIQIHLATRGFADCFIDHGIIQDQTDTSSADGRVNHDVTSDRNNHNAQPTTDDTTPYFGKDDEEDSCDDNTTATNTLIRNIISGTILHGQTKDDMADKQVEVFLKLLDQAKKELYPECKNLTKVSFIVEPF